MLILLHPHTTTLQLRLLVEQIEFIEEQVSVVEDAVDQVMEELRPGIDIPYRHVLEMIPVIGPVLAAAIIGEVGNITRFPNAKTLVAYAEYPKSTNASAIYPLNNKSISPGYGLRTFTSSKLKQT